MATATQELLTLQKIQADIEDDILKQKNKGEWCRISFDVCAYFICVVLHCDVKILKQL